MAPDSDSKAREYKLPVRWEWLTIEVLIASPGDVSYARDEVEDALHEWNDMRSPASGAILRPRRWEISAVPLSGRGDAQSVINTQLVDNSDIVIGIFHRRLGTSTARAISGTVEEIERSIEQGKLVHLYFCTGDLPYDLDLKQFTALRKFKQQMERSGLIATYVDHAELRSQVVRAIEYDLEILQGRKVRGLTEEMLQEAVKNLIAHDESLAAQIYRRAMAH